MSLAFVLTKAFSLIWLVGFIIVGAFLAVDPKRFTGVDIFEGSALWHALSIAYMATITVLVLFPAFDPVRYWGYLLPLAVAKFSSSCLLFYWYRVFRGRTLLVSGLVDGSIGIVALFIFTYIYGHI